MADSLRHKTIHGVGWSFIDNISNSGITFLVGLVLARLLTPEEYGIMAMIAIFIAISNSIIDSGFSNALIRKTRIERVDYSTVFYFNLTVSILIYALLYLAAPTISVFFKEPVLLAVIRIIGWVLIINALAIIPRTQFVRNVDFKTQTKVSLISSISSGVIGIGMALGGMGVWSLVGQQLFRQFLNTLFLWVYSKWHPVWEFSMKSFKELFGFGSKLLLSGLLDTIYKNIYYIVIGRFYTSAQLGQYTRAEQFNMIFSSNLTSVVQRVSYPVLSSIQEEPERLREAYRKVIKITMLITFACMLGLAAVAKPLILILIGEKWLPAVYFLQIICFSGILYPLHAINLNILQVKGRSDLFLKLEIIKKIIAVGPIVVGIAYGIEYMLWGSVLTSFIAYFLNSYYSANLINYPTGEQLKDILPTFLISFVVAAFMWSVSFWNISVYALLPIQLFAGILLALFIYEKLHLDEYLEVKQLVLSVLKRR
ncbi:lipopolysaccharide biosynthesis protein [Bacteroides stercorirosoris]|uniref:Membrane protein involved in the export of O-antigen and teichoic acid n=1 Tax=Bacteroides stercorirosoris TaxID=871324 RepID=A0A1M6GR39_9BACE|nr:lipopolysaccharide biosynthesis protein [Bacteroides stercorirosoris]SHJ12383.1 Membrane protein involved in the export of O-antigen and teichoic acid [Bacteroides stercorirosoris]